LHYQVKCRSILELLYWIFHKNRLYISRCSDKSSTGLTNVYDRLGEMIPEGKELRGEGNRHGVYIISIPLGATYAYGVCASIYLSSSFIPIFYYSSSIWSLEDVLSGMLEGKQPFISWSFSGMCADW
jgi:hypothetical protein